MPVALRHQCWILLAAAVVFFTNLGSVALWDEDEPLYASCAREMFQRGDWVVPMFNGEMFPEKPPLMFWLMISGFELFGVTEFAVRFWSAVLGVGTALVTYHLGRLLFRAEVGLWAGLIVASSIIFTVSARAATVDSALVFFTSLAVLLFVAGGMAKRRNAAEATRDVETTDTPGTALVPDSWLTFVLFYACLAATVLSKGPIGLVLPVAAIGLFLLIMNQSPRTDDLQPTDGRGRWAARLLGLLRPFGPRNVLRVAWQMRPLTALVVVGAIALPWYVLVGLRTDGVWLEKFLGEQNLSRALNPLQGHGGPIFYYLPAIFIGFFPWSVLLIPSLVESTRRIRQGHAWKPAYVFVVCWIGLFVAFYSVCSTKLPHYVLPAYPALALLTACFIHGWITEPGRVDRVRMRVACATVIVVGLGIMVAIPIVTWIFLPGEWMLGLVGLILVAGGAVCLRFAERSRRVQAAVTLAVTSVVFLTAMFGFAALRVDRYQNAPALMAEIRRAGPETPQLVTYDFFRESLVFYAGEPVTRCGDIDGLREFLDGVDHAYVVTTDKHEEELKERFEGQLFELIRRRRFLRSGEVVVLARRGDSEVLHTAARQKR